ncbi:MAG TPA: YciI family protein [Thermoanaerobaculia bacterium]
MAQYVLMLRDKGTYDALSPEELQKIFGRFRTWSDKLRAQGKITGGQKLRDHQGRVMRKNAVTDGPFAEAKEIIGGFFVVDAKSYDEAVSLASGCPHLDYGSIEIREIDPMTGNA